MNLYPLLLGGRRKSDSSWEFGKILRVSRLGQQACKFGKSLPPLCLKISNPSAKFLIFDKPVKTDCTEELNPVSARSKSDGFWTRDISLGMGSREIISRTTISKSGFIYKNKVLTPAIILSAIA